MAEGRCAMSTTNGHAPALPGIAPDVVAARGYQRILSERQLSAYSETLSERQRQIPGLLIPVYQLGIETPYEHVLRPDRPRMGYDGKMVKYEWPERVPLCLDVLPCYREALADTTIPIWITEGAKKADALASAFGSTIVPININGVWGWRRRSKDGASHPIDDLDKIAWAGRRVVLAFDNDVTRKPEVQQALRALTKHLKGRGALVRVLVLPDDGVKLGVDDALADGMTADQLQEHVYDELPRPSTDEASTRIWLTEDELDNLPPPEWLIDQEIAANGITVLYGPSGSGKTFVALDYAMRIAQEQKVMYVAAEDAQGLAIRKRAWRAWHNTTAGTFYTWPEELNLLDGVAVDTFIEQTRDLGLKLIQFDTLHQCMVGGDENSSRDMGVVIQSCKRIQRETGAGVMLIHHTGKNGSSERGSSALRGAAYTMLELTNDDGLIRLSCDKAKNSAPFGERHMRLLETNGSCVVVPADSVISTRGAPLTNAQRRILETLNLSIFDDIGARASQLDQAVNLPHNTMYRTLSTLKSLGYISQSTKGDPYFIAEEGRAALDRSTNGSALPNQQVPQVPPQYQGSTGTPSAPGSTKYHDVPHSFRSGTGGTGTQAEPGQNTIQNIKSLHDKVKDLKSDARACIERGDHDVASQIARGIPFNADRSEIEAEIAAARGAL